MAKKNKPFNVASFSDGIGIGGLALSKVLNEAGRSPGTYWRSDIDPYTEAVATRALKEKGWDVRNLGNMKNVDPEQLAKEGIECVMGGPPCQDFSRVGRGRQSVDEILAKLEEARGGKAGLTNIYLNAVKAINPKHFLMENVTGMDKKITDALNSMVQEAVGKPIKNSNIDARNFGPLSRPRNWWSTADLSDLEKHRDPLHKLGDTKIDPVAFTILNTAIEKGMTQDDIKKMIMEVDPDEWIPITNVMGTPIATMGSRGQETSMGREFERGTGNYFKAKKNRSGNFGYDLSGKAKMRDFADYVHPSERLIELHNKYSPEEVKEMVAINNKAKAAGKEKPYDIPHGSIRQNLTMEQGKRYDLDMPTPDEYELAMGMDAGLTQLDPQQAAEIEAAIKAGKVDPDFLAYAGSPKYDRYHMVGNSWAQYVAEAIFRKMLEDEIKKHTVDTSDFITKCLSDRDRAKIDGVLKQFRFS